MNASLSLLHPYPFEKLAQLFQDVKPADLPLIPLSIGEPKHPAPEFVKQAIIDNFQHLSTYPNSKGLVELRESIAQWLSRRFHLNSISAEDHVIPVTGTREGIFSFVQALINRDDAPYVVMPNPFYQIYEGATLLAGAQPYFINCTEENGYLGFVAGDAALLKPYLKFRTYHGAAMPVQHQLASIVAWNDESHVEENRQLYRAKFELFQNELGHLLPLQKPDAGFYYWLKVDHDENFAKMLMEKANIKVLPGRYLSRDTAQGNPGEGHVRMALVADIAQCEQVIQRLKAIL
ncbi:hypothetical protein FQR65_LT17201 [Abscondita terminalis]|nr:hypothetical protein FQR65_LT17201 [Abscondita terminalis]